MMKWGRGWERKKRGAIQRKTSGMGREGGGGGGEQPIKEKERLMGHQNRKHACLPPNTS